MAGLLYPAYQKFYSALSSLERFDKEQNFFDNISSLDNFFSEYRNITFVIQAALKHTQYFDDYVSNRDKYLTDHWFVEKRNQITKQQPFQLVKELDVTLYHAMGHENVYTKSFTVENDLPWTSVIEELKNMFTQISSPEIFFSAKFAYHENGKDIDLWDKLMSGITAMQQFMDAMYNNIGENCLLSSQLQKQIHNSKILLIPKDFLFINDYVYYPLADKFEKADRMAMLLGTEGKKVANHRLLKEFTESKYFNYDGTPFGTFVLMHAFIGTVRSDADIMPAIMVVYDDDTYDLDAFHANVKTTIYRKINEVAQHILHESIKEVFFVSLYTSLPDQKNVPLLSKERVELAETEILAVMRVDYDLNVEEYVFDRKSLSSMDYLACAMKYGRKQRLDVGAFNMMPILNAFREKQQKHSNLTKL